MGNRRMNEKWNDHVQRMEDRKLLVEALKINQKGVNFQIVLKGMKLNQERA
jgi:hypothetical protein